MSICKQTALLFAAAFVAACSKSAAEDPYMTLDGKDFTVEAEGGTVTMALSANVDYNAINDIEWAELSKGASKGDLTEWTLEVEPSTSTEPRIGYVRFIGEDVTPLKATVTQKAYVPTGISTENIEVAFSATSATFKVLGEKAWTITSDNAAFVPDPASGTGNADITVTFPENESESDVTVHITVKMGGKDYVLTIKQGGVPTSATAVDLSAQASANCYIIHTGGWYKFKADVRGNGVAVESTPEITPAISPASVDVLWCTFNSAEVPESKYAIVKSVELKDGYVLFNTDLKALPEGNAVIAAYDSSSNILWTWHIWSRKDAVRTYSCGASEWMDYNLGALSNARANYASVGLYFQWGRKDPLRSGVAEVYGGSQSFIGTAGSEWPETKLVDDTSTMLYSIEHPQSHFVENGKTHPNLDEWLWIPREGDNPPSKDKQKNDLWGGTGSSVTGKTMYDPCPAGYRVPSADQITEVKTTYDFGKSNISSSEFYFGNDSFWFISGGALLFRDTGAFYFSAHAYPSRDTVVKSDYDEYCYVALMYTTAVNYARQYQKSFATTLRCVKE